MHPPIPHEAGAVVTTPDEIWQGILKNVADQLHRFPMFEGNVSKAAFWQDLGRIHINCPVDPDSRCGRSIARSRQLGRLTLFGWRSDHETVFTIEETAEKYLLWFPLTGNLNFRRPLERSAHRIPPGSIGVMPVLAETQCTLNAESRLLALMVPQTALVDGISALIGLPVTGRVSFDDRRLPVESGVGSAVVQALALADSVMSDDNLVTIPALTSRLEDLLVLSMLAGLPHSFTDVRANEQRTAVPRTVTVAESYIRSHAGDSITIQDIAGATGCSVRAVQIAFRRFRRTTPMAFLRRVRVEQAYEALIHPDPGTTVTDVAANWHFSHLSRLAARFRQIYGETPYDVLKRGRRRRGQQ